MTIMEWVEGMGVASGSAWNLWVWLAGGGCGWNLQVWLVGVVVRQYIDFPHNITTPLVSVLCICFLFLFLYFCYSFLCIKNFFCAV